MARCRDDEPVGLAALEQGDDVGAPIEGAVAVCRNSGRIGIDVGDARELDVRQARDGPQMLLAEKAGTGESQPDAHGRAPSAPAPQTSAQTCRAVGELRRVPAQRRDGGGPRQIGGDAHLEPQQARGVRHFLVADEDDVVHSAPHGVEDALVRAPAAHGRHPRSDLVERDHLALIEARLEGRRSLGLDPDDAYRGTARSERRGEARDQSAAADGDDDGIDIGKVFQDFEAERALSRNDERIGEGVEIGGAGSARRRREPPHSTGSIPSPTISTSACQAFILATLAGETLAGTKIARRHVRREGGARHRKSVIAARGGDDAVARSRPAACRAAGSWRRAP